MSDKEWKLRERALIPVTVTGFGENGWVQVAVGNEADGYYLSVDGAGLISDDRKPEWLPGQPGDVAEWGGVRFGRDGNWWHPIVSAPDVASVTDDDVPADAVRFFKGE